MRAVYQAENILDAHLVRNALEARGVRAFVTGEFLIGAGGQLPGLVAVLVEDEDFPAAQAAVAEIEAMRLDADPLDDPDLAPGMA